MGQGTAQDLSSSLPAGDQHVGHHSSSSISSILPGSEWKAAWQPNLSPLLSGCAIPGTDRAGTIGSAFSAWVPTQASGGYSLQTSNPNSNLNLGHAVPAAVNAGSPTGTFFAEPNLAPSRPPDVFPPFSFPTLQAQPPDVVPSTSQSSGTAPLASQTAPRLSAGAGLSYKPLSLGFPLQGLVLPSQIAAQVPGSPASRAEIPALPCGIGAPAFPALLPHMPMLPGMPNLSQWPLNLNPAHPAGGSQPLPFPSFGYGVSPYPVGFGQMPPQLPLPFQFPTNPQSASSTASSYLPSAIQGLHHLPPNLPCHLLPNLPYHLPPYPPHPLQTLTSSQPHLFGQPYVLPPGPAQLIKQEADFSAPQPFPPRTLAPEQHPPHGQTLHQPQLASYNWHEAGGMLSGGDRYTPAGMHHDKTNATSLAHLSGGNIAKMEQKPPGQAL